MLAYIRGFLRPFLGHGFLWWFSLVITYVLGTGYLSDYGLVRERVNAWQSFYSLPEEVPAWLIALPYLIWVVARAAHGEALRTARAAWIVVDGLEVLREVRLFRSVFVPSRHRIPDGETKEVLEERREEVASNDIVRIAVRNTPFDPESGRPVQDAFVEVRIFEQSTGKRVLDFSFPRWTENEKPGYEGSPSDRYPDEWNYRTLNPNGSRNSIDFLLKGFSDENAYGFRGSSQRKTAWRDDELCVGPGKYYARLSIKGYGLRSPKIIWCVFEHAGKDSAIKADLIQKAPREIVESI